MANKFKISSLTELFDSFGENYQQQQKPDACDEYVEVSK